MKLGEEVPRHFLTVLSSGTPTPLTKGSGRLELADIIATHPLSARVIVNRIWKGHFGTGIVDTPSNFGANGEAPTNPALLEYSGCDLRRARPVVEATASRHHAVRGLSAW